MNNWLAYLGGAVAALLAALFAVPAMVDWNGYRGVFEEEATRVLGRDVRLGGNVNLRLLPAPYVSFEKMRISDPDSQTGEPLFRTESFTMWLAISPLLQGVLQANQVELKNPVLKLAVNADGSGNWSKFKLTPGTLPFVPADVLLNSVKLSNGEIGLVGPKGNEVVKLEAINGELTADGLSGPFRFRGQLTSSGEARDVRFASAPPDADGTIRFKTSVTGTGTLSSYILDGAMSDVGGKLGVTGELVAKIAPDLSAASRAPDAAATPPPPAPRPAPEISVSATPGANEPKTSVPVPTAVATGAPLYDMVGKVAGDASGFKLSDITITSATGGLPQLVTGTAQLSWGERTKLDLALNSRWLDLDAMFGTGKTVVPLEAARGLFDVLMRQLPATSDTNINLAVDQLNLGADQISDVRFAAVRAGGPLEVKDFQVALPGATHLSLSGKLAPGESAPKFEGIVGLKGQNLSRFLAWGLKNPTMTDGLGDGAFALNGNLKFSGKQIELENAKIGIGDTPITAGLRLDLNDRRHLAINLEGQKIDFSRIWPGGLQIETLVPLLAQTASTAAKDASPAPAVVAAERWFDPANSDLVIGIKAGTVIDGTRTLRNVEADVSVEGGKLAMRQLKFADDAGLEVELEGEASDLSTAAAQGSVRGLIVAPNKETAAAFVDLAGLDTFAPDLAVYLQRLAPLRLAARLNLGTAGAPGADLALDGLVRGGRLTGTVGLEGGLANWRGAPANLSARIDTPDIDQALTALLGIDVPAAGAARPGKILVRSTGAPRDGLLSFAAIESEALKLDYNGRVVLPADAPVAFDGEVKVDGRDARTVMAMAGLKLPAATASVPLSGSLTVARTGDLLTLTPIDLALAGTSVRGTTSIRQNGATRTVAADLTVSDVSVVGLLATMLDRAPTAAAPPAPPGNARQAAPASPAPDDAPKLWPEQAFDLSALDRIDGKITLHAATLALQPGLSIANAKAEITLDAGRLSVTALDGDALGGKFASTMTFAKGSAGVGFDGGLSIRVPAAVSAGAEPADAVALTLKYAGRALSPAALVADLNGTGELKLGEVSLGGMSPAIIGSVSEAVLMGRGPQSGEPFLAALRSGLREGQLKIGALAMPITIGEGSVKLAKVELDRPDGRTTFETVVDLATLKLDSEWNIEARLPKTMGKAGAKPLPPVSVVYTGTLGDVSSIQPQISAAALERELTVRKMERDVEELERLRKDDEARGKAEQDRVKAEQERVRQEKARAAAAAAAVDDPQPAPNATGTDATVDQTPLPPAGADRQPGSAPQPQTGVAPPNGAAPAGQQAAGADPNAPTSEAAAAQAAPRQAPAKRRPTPKDSWNPFTNQF